jgi:phosphopantetheinyl transferase
MPLFYQHDINQDTKLGVWRIEEPEIHFLSKVPVKRDVSHPHKRLQHLAGRYLLPTLFADFPLTEILIADTQKPFLENDKYHFSISHCANFAAALVSRSSRVGVDLEKIDRRVERIREKFLMPRELAWARDQWAQLAEGTINPGAFVEISMLTTLWSCKEALFKWYGLGQVDFKKNMSLDGPIIRCPDGLLQLPFLFRKNEPLRLQVQVKIWDDLVLAWVLG